MKMQRDLVTEQYNLLDVSILSTTKEIIQPN